MNSTHEPPAGWYQNYYRPPQRIAPPPASPDRRAKWAWVYYVLRNVTVAFPAIIIILIINIYVSRSGQRATNGVSASDPVYLDLYLGVPVSVAHIVWGLVAVCLLQRWARSYRSKTIPQPVVLVIELVLGVGALVCFILMVVQIVGKKNSGTYGYPYEAVEGALAFLLGVIWVCDFAFCERAWHEIRRERWRRDESIVV